MSASESGTGPTKTDETVVDLREDQPWLLLPKAALDVLADETLSFPQDLPLREASEEALRLTESFLAKILLRQARGLGMLYGYRRAVERKARERAFREGIHFALSVLRRLANSPEDTEEWRREDQRRDQAT